MCVHLCMSRGQWEWWVCKRVTSSGLYIAPPSSPRLSLGAVLKFQPNSSGQISTRSRLYLTATENYKTAGKSHSQRSTLFQCHFPMRGFQGQGSCRTVEWWQAGIGAEAKVEIDSWSAGSCSSEAWGPAQPRIHPGLCWSSTLEHFSIPVGRVHSRVTTELVGCLPCYFERTLWHQLSLCDCNTRRLQDVFTRAVLLWLFRSVDSAYFHLDLNVEYSCHGVFLYDPRCTFFALPDNHFLKDGASHFQLWLNLPSARARHYSDVCTCIRE